MVGFNPAPHLQPGYFEVSFPKTTWPHFRLSLRTQFSTNQNLPTVAVQVNDKAPAFTLFSEAKAPVSLSDYQGKNLVINFFPLAFTGVCTEQMCSMRDALAQYNELDTEVVGISVDTVFTLEKFKEAEKLNFPLLSDFNKEVSRHYGALYEEFVLGMRGVSKRAAFVVDKEGVVRYAEVLESAGDLPNFTAIKTTLEQIQ